MSRAWLSRAAAAVLLGSILVSDVEDGVPEDRGGQKE